MEDAIVLSQTYDIPYDMVCKILSKRKTECPSFFRWLLFGESEHELPYSNDEYRLMLLGAREVYHNQHLLGTALPPDDPRSEELREFLNSRGLAIQFHPHHGMQIISTFGRMKVENTLAWLEKQGAKDKLIEDKDKLIKDPCKSCDNIKLNCHNFPCSLKQEYEKNRQKPAWSEEDEKILKLSLENLTELKNNFGEKYGKVGDYIDWLKSLKPQPNQYDKGFNNGYSAAKYNK